MTRPPSAPAAAAAVRPSSPQARRRCWQPAAGVAAAARIRPLPAVRGGAGGNPAGNGQDGDGLVPGPGGSGAKPGLGVSGQGGQNRFDIAGAGGGGGAGWNIPGGQTGGGAGGISSLDPNKYGNGGGGGGGAGASSAEAAATEREFRHRQRVRQRHRLHHLGSAADIHHLAGNAASPGWASRPRFTAVVGPAGTRGGRARRHRHRELLRRRPALLGNAPLRLNASGQDVATFIDLGARLPACTASPRPTTATPSMPAAPLIRSARRSPRPIAFTSPAKLAGVVGVPLVVHGEHDRLPGTWAAGQGQARRPDAHRPR